MDLFCVSLKAYSVSGVVYTIRSTLLVYRFALVGKNNITEI